MNERRNQRPVHTGPAPARMPRRAAQPRKPRLPEGQRPYIDKDALRDLRGSARPEQVDDTIKAFHIASEALEEGDIPRALEYLEWVKSVAPRSGVIRESLGVAYYLQGDFAKANSELLAYRRITNRYDQNHLLADCARAAERHDKVAEYVEEMIEHKVARGRIAEGLIVLAGDRADRGDLQGALDTLNRAGLNPVVVEDWHVRIWYAAAEFAARMGDVDAEREYLEAVAAVDEDFLDVQERLTRLTE